MDLPNYNNMLAGKPYRSEGEIVDIMFENAALVDKLNRTPMSKVEKRKKLYKKIFKSVGENLMLREGLRIDFGRHTTIGNNCCINYNCVILDVCPVTIGNDVLIAPNVCFYAATHPLKAEDRLQYEYGGPITVEDNVWIGGSSIILPGVTIGARSVVAAGSVVTRDVPPDSLVMGSPARVVKQLNQDQKNDKF